MSDAPVRPDASTMRAWSALLVAHRRVTTLLDDELQREVGCTLDDYDVLYQLHRAGTPLRMRELAERVLISRPTTTRVVDRLVERGWVQRHADPADRRVVLVELSAEGRSVLRRAGSVHERGIQEHFGVPLAGREVDAVADALEATVAER